MTILRVSPSGSSLSLSLRITSLNMEHYLLSAYRVLSTVLGIELAVVNIAIRVPALMELTLWWMRQTIQTK